MVSEHGPPPGAVTFEIDGRRTEVIFSGPPLQRYSADSMLQRYSADSMLQRYSADSIAAVQSRSAMPPRRAVTVTVFDANTIGLFGAGAENPVTIPCGESAKSWKNVESILARCASIGMSRDGTIVGVGGGVVCDLAGFSASLYMRGCRLALVPTTLLAMVDASLGGKTGIDFLGFKNLVGTFYPAERIEIGAWRLQSLPMREYLSGLAEAIKTALIGDPELFAVIRDERQAVLQRDPAVVEEIIRRSLAVKGRIVGEDPRESSARALLNLGHTFGHALESATGFTGWTHGEAVAWGIGKALLAGERLGITSGDFKANVTSLLVSYDFRLDADVPFSDLAPAFERDKKRRGGRIRLVVPRGFCDVAVLEVSESWIEETLGGGSGGNR